ncbi:MAG: hypothetical protein CMO34_02120 [Verrucomicrobia bacterium]|nr:hypothetical protein [Verrucomicrobiota bacterium]
MRFNNPILHLYIILFIFLFITTNFHWGKDNWKGVLESDAKGYYAYLPALFIYQDLNFKFIDRIEQSEFTSPHLRYEFRVTSHGQSLNKYFVGTSICQLPFFGIAHGLAILSEYPANGYSVWYMRMVTIAALFYCGLGLYFFILLARRFQMSSTVLSLMLYAIAFGTHLFVYTLVEPGMSHVYSFGLISMFVYLLHEYLIRKKPSKMIYALAALLSIIVLIRPTNILVLLLVPFLAGSISRIIEFFKQQFKRILPLVISVIIFGLGLGIQALWYKFATGYWWIYSYGSEGFDFYNPHFIDILFSYKKGLFLYTPMLLLGFLSTFFLWQKKERFRFFCWISFFTVITYILSSWHSWYYGGSFSSRVYVEYIPLFMLPLGLYLSSLNLSYKRTLSSILVVLLIAMCQIQSYQYRYYDIHYSEMDKERYWQVFLMRNKY